MIWLVVISFIFILVNFIIDVFGRKDVENRLSEIELELGIKTQLDIVKEKQRMKERANTLEKAGIWTKWGE